MNFKRMNVLLIMLALVVLVGLGSVSAASDDGADIISDSITDDMLLDNEMAAHFSILAWRIPWTEEPGWLQSMGSQRVRPD